MIDDHLFLYLRRLLWQLSRDVTIKLVVAQVFSWLTSRNSVLANPTHLVDDLRPHNHVTYAKNFTHCRQFNELITNCACHSHVNNPPRTSIHEQPAYYSR